MKHRPCAIVLTIADEGEALRCLVVPVTHSAPSVSTEALELPPGTKRHLGLDAERSWVVLSECNDFVLPGPDLRRVGDDGDAAVAYGFLPPRVFAELRRRFVALARDRRNVRFLRTE